MLRWKFQLTWDTNTGILLLASCVCFFDLTLKPVTAATTDTTWLCRLAIHLHLESLIAANAESWCIIYVVRGVVKEWCRVSVSRQLLQLFSHDLILFWNVVFQVMIPLETRRRLPAYREKLLISYRGIGAEDRSSSVLRNVCNYTYLCERCHKLDDHSLNFSVSWKS